MPTAAGAPSSRSTTQAAVLGERPVVLRDLVALGEVRDRSSSSARTPSVSCTVHSSASAVRTANRTASRVEHRQRARQREADRTGVHVRQRAVLRCCTSRTPWCACGAARAPRGRRPSRSPPAALTGAPPCRARASSAYATRNIAGFVEVVGDDLAADGQPVHAADRDRHRRHAGEVRRRREDVVQVHLVRVRLRAEGEGRRRRGRREAARARRESKTRRKSLRDERAHVLRPPVVRVVVAGREHVGAEQDAARHLGAEAARARRLVHAAQPVALEAHAVAHAVEAREVRARLGRRDDVVDRDGERGVREARPRAPSAPRARSASSARSQRSTIARVERRRGSTPAAGRSRRP